MSLLLRGQRGQGHIEIEVQPGTEGKQTEGEKMIIYSNGWLQPKLNSKWHYFGENGMSFCGKLRTKKKTGFVPGVRTKESACLSCWNKKAEVDKKVAGSPTGMIEPTFKPHMASGGQVVDCQYLDENGNIIPKITNLVCRYICEHGERPTYLILGSDALMKLISEVDSLLLDTNGRTIMQFQGMLVCTVTSRIKEAEPMLVDVA
jgi:hypothetical protein